MTERDDKLSVEAVRALPVDEAAMPLLQRLVADGPTGRLLVRGNAGLAGHWNVGDLPTEQREGFLRAIVEAWDWLAHRGLVALLPDSDVWGYVTKRGLSIAAETDGLETVKATTR